METHNTVHMSEERVLHVYSDARKKDQEDTWDALSVIESQFKVEHVHVLRDSDYGDIIKRNWGRGHNLILVEQDIVPAAGQIRELLSCRGNLCAFPYLVKADIPNRYSVFNFQRGKRPDNWKTFDNSRYIGNIPIEKRPKYCGLSGFGLTKISIKAQEKFNFPKLYNLGRWDIIDSWLSLNLYERVGRNRIFHLHYPPVKHNHYSDMPNPAPEPPGTLLVF